MSRLVLLSACALVAGGLASAGQVPAYDHIVVVIEENHGFSQIFGSGSATYINSLIAQGALLTDSFAATHPSQPNYLELFSGSNQGVTDNSNPGSFSTPNLGSLLIAAGHTFTGFSEDLPSVGFTGDSSGNYVRRHNPWVDFSNVSSASNRPFSDFPSDFSLLPSVAFVVPNLIDDMHDGTIAQGDAWLQTNLGPLAAWVTAHNSLFIITFDEDNGAESNHVFTLLVGAHIVPGSYNDATTHDRILRTIEDSFQTGYAGNSAGVSPLTSPFEVPEPATGLLAGLFLGVGLLRRFSGSV